MENVVIVSAARTAIGSFMGSLSGIHAPDLGAITLKEVLARAKFDPKEIDDVILGNVLQAGQGQGPARQAMLAAGIPDAVPAMTINILCGSGLHSVTLATQAIRAGVSTAVFTGGFESMSRAPFVTDASARTGYRMGNQTLKDVLLQDGLLCAINGYHMGITAENIVKQFGITRQEQDEVALASQQKALAAIEKGAFKKEIVPVTIKVKREDKLFDTDEYPKATTMESLTKLKPAFDKEGTVTAGNASGINDGAAALLVMAESKAKALGLPILARVRAATAAGVDPKVMGLGPIPSTRKALKLAGLTIKDIDLVEANEAFAAQFIAVGRELNFDLNKVNVNGGAIALGHPIGASGARILVTLLHALEARNKTLGLATLCIGGGMGSSVIVERV
ncbi:MAG: acetyl-CoA C-acetyltransferase [Saezia sp.]